MAGMIRSIFGLTTEDVREQQLNQQQAAAQQFAKQTGANQGVASIGTAIGAGLGRGLMSRLGFEDPAMAKAEEAEARQTALNEQLAALDLNDPRRQYLLAEALSSMGDTERSLAAYASGRQMEQYQSQLEEQDRMFNFRQSEQDRMLDLRQIEQEAISQRAKDTIFAKLLELNSPEEARKIMREIYGGSSTPAKTTVLPATTDDNKLTPEKLPAKTTKPKPKPGEMQIGDMMGTGDNRTIKVGENDVRLVSEFTTEQLKAIRAAPRQDAGEAWNDAVLEKARELPSSLGDGILNFIIDPQNIRGQ